MTSMFTNKSVEFHTAESDIYNKLCAEFPDAELEGKNFGVLNVTANKVGIDQRDIIIFFTLDISASMGEYSCYGKKKIDFVKHTMKNILNKLATIQDANIQICIMTFNTNVMTLLDITQITQDNVEQIIKDVMAIEPDFQTNLEKIFASVAKKINKYKGSTRRKIVHINMTDGEITVGENDAENLKRLLNEDIDNIFIGFGKHHDSKMLKELSTIKNGDYRFVDRIENTGMIYGEVIHNILYTAFENVYLSIENGEVYNWEKNNWTKHLYIGNIYSEQQRNFHIRCVDKDDLRTFIFYRKIQPVKEEAVLDNYMSFGAMLEFDTCDCLPYLLDENNMVLSNDMTHFMFRQKTQEILFGQPNKEKMEKMIKLITEVLPLYDSDENARRMIKLLCDDLVVSYKTMDTPFSEMYSCARQTSQGRQTTYTVNILDEEIHGGDLFEGTMPPRAPSLRRQTNNTLNYDNINNNYINNNYIDNDEYSD